MDTFPSVLKRYHSEPFIITISSRRHPGEAGSSRTSWDKPPTQDQESPTDTSRAALGIDNSAPAVDFYREGHFPTSNTGSKESLAASLDSRVGKRGLQSSREQQHQSNVLIGPDYDYWADVADSW
jgi:hypothetical protein